MFPWRALTFRVSVPGGVMYVLADRARSRRRMRTALERSGGTIHVTEKRDELAVRMPAVSFPEGPMVSLVLEEDDGAPDRLRGRSDLVAEGFHVHSLNCEGADRETFGLYLMPRPGLYSVAWGWEQDPPSGQPQGELALCRVRDLTAEEAAAGEVIPVDPDLPVASLGVQIAGPRLAFGAAAAHGLPPEVEFDVAAGAVQFGVCLFDDRWDGDMTSREVHGSGSVMVPVDGPRDWALTDVGRDEEELVVTLKEGAYRLDWWLTGLHVPQGMFLHVTAAD